MYKRNITKLLICGGAFKFFYLIGAIKYLSDNNLLDNINEFIGVSAGAILSTIFSVGYTIDELNSFVMEFNFEKLIDPHLDNLIENKGLDNGEIKKLMIQQFFKMKDIDPDINFQKLYELTNKKLSFVSTNITLNKQEILNYETYPDMPVWKGLLITSSLPILFEPVIFNNCYYGDGAILDNYPIELFQDENILGINMVTFIDNIDLDIDIFNYITKLYVISSNWKSITKNSIYEKCTISIITNDPLELLKMDVALEDRIKRIDNGYESAKKHFIEFELIEPITVPDSVEVIDNSEKPETSEIPEIPETSEISETPEIPELPETPVISDIFKISENKIIVSDEEVEKKVNDVNYII